MRFKNKYEYYTNSYSKKHTYTCIGAKGAVHFHVSEYLQNNGNFPKHSAGLEFHHRHPPEYMKDDCPSHEKCWLIGCPCWHDGTSLYAEERVLPKWLLDKNDHDNMFAELEYEYKKHFEGDKQ